MDTREKITVTIPNIEDVKFEIIPSYEDLPIKGNAIQSGDEDLDRQVENEINRRLDDGDIWAWALVEVKATYRGLVSSDYLGGCSYKDQKEFEAHGYYEDMKERAYRRIVQQIKDLQ